MPIVGNLRAIDLAQPIESLMSLAREHGPIFKLTSPAGISVAVSGVDLVSEICDDARFDKVIAAGLSILADGQVAFSREPGQPRTFVQHMIERERDHVWDLIEDGAVIYVCGNANTMAPGVRAALMDVYRAKTDGSGSTGEEWLARLREDDRYLEDIWGEMASAL